MAAADAIATVSLPWLGQRPAETYEQLCSSLLALDDAVEEVFGRVEKRCASEGQKLQKLEERIASAQERARRITGSSAATVVLAAARYPAPTQQPDFERLFYDEAKLSSRAGDASKPRAAEAQEAPAAQAERRRAAAAAAAAAVDPLDEYTYALSLRPELAANYAPDASEPPTGLGTLPDAMQPRPALAFHPSSKYLYASSQQPGQEGLLQVWELATQTPVAELRGHQASVRDVALAPLNTRLARSRTISTASSTAIIAPGDAFWRWKVGTHNQ